MDLVKFIMAIFVVAIHTHPYDSIGNVYISFLVQKLISLAVPFFFVASGFFLWRKIDNVTYDDQLLVLRRWIERFIKIYIIWTIIYLPFTIYGYINDGLSPLKALLVFVRNFLFVGENLFSWPLWYILATITAGIMFYVMVYFHINKYYIHVCAIVALLLGHFIDNTKEIFDLSALYFKLFYTTKNGLFVGFPYLVIGSVIASQGIINKRSILIILLTLSFIAHCFGYVFARYIVAYLLFSLVVGLNIKSSSKVFDYFRQSSLVIYFVHMIFVGCICLWGIDFSPLSVFLIVTIMSLLTARFVINNQNRSIVKLIFQE